MPERDGYGRVDGGEKQRIKLRSAAISSPITLPFRRGRRKGVQPEILAQVFKTSGARLFYSQSTHANPTGATLAPLRRQGALDVVARAGAILIEDDWCRELSFAKMPLPPLASGDRNGHCVYLRSLTKAGEAGELDG